MRLNLALPALHDRLTGPWGRKAVIGVPLIFLLMFFLLPFLVVMKISVSDMENVVFKDLLVWSDGVLQLKIKLANYLFIGEDELYLSAYLSSLKFAAITTVLCLIIAYPFAYFMARSPADKRPALLMLVMLPFWTSFLLRVYAWKMLLADNGVFNNLALMAGLLDEPVKMMNTPFSLVLGMVYTYLPFMILPLYANLERLDPTLDEAAMDLGSRPFAVFRDVTLPQSIPGIIAGGMLVFIPAAGELVIPTLVGDSSAPMIGRVISDEFSSARDWPMASAVAVALLILMVGPMMIYARFDARAQARERQG